MFRVLHNCRTHSNCSLFVAYYSNHLAADIPARAKLIADAAAEIRLHACSCMEDSIDNRESALIRDSSSSWQKQSVKEAFSDLASNCDLDPKPKTSL